MRQVPQYLIIGNGRVARHFEHYLSLLSLSFSSWNRHLSLTELRYKLNRATHILLLISDKSIAEFHQKYLKKEAIYIHFSGSLVLENVYGCHPLMSFNQQFYDLKTYQSIPFIIEENALSFAELLPGLPNPHRKIHRKLKAKYHALCVLSGNFSCMLWQKLFASFEKEFNIPADFAKPYLIQQTNNILENFKTALTGPLVRQDVQTINHNLKALENDAFQTVYESFVACYKKINEENLQ